MGRRALLVYPEIPPTYWSFRYAMPFIGKKAAFPPLGLLTVAALFPDDFELSLVDMNTTRLTGEAVAAADLVFVSAMLVQRDSFREVVRLCRERGTPVVAGGPYPTTAADGLEGVDHLVLGEAEETLPRFLGDLLRGRAAPIYRSAARPDITRSPIPRFDLLRMGDYAAMSLQFSRGCPHDCEFCDIVSLFGRAPRTKTPPQFLAEMDRLYSAGWRGGVFVVDDNFIGNRRAVRDLLPQIAGWQERHGYPFSLFTETTLALAADPALPELMVEAGFGMVFLGIETPVEETLRVLGKTANLRGDLVQDVRLIQRAGMEASAGFILGFDGDPPDVFSRMVRFIDEAGIPTAMVGLLTAIPGTRLHRRLEAEGRLRNESSGNNTNDLRLNFAPRMDERELLAGYRKVLEELYTPERYFERCLSLLRNLRAHRSLKRRITGTELRAFALSLVVQTFSSYGWAYWSFLVRGLRAQPGLAAEIVTMAIKGHHFFKMTRRVLEVERFKGTCDRLAAALRERAARLSPRDRAAGGAELRACRDRMLHDLERRLRRVHRDFRIYAEQALREFLLGTDALVAGVAAG